MGEVPLLRRVARIASGWSEDEGHYERGLKDCDPSRLTRLTAVFRRSSEAAAAAAVVGFGHVLAIDDQRSPHQVITLSDFAVGVPLVHVCEVLLHFGRREEADNFDAQRLKDVLLEVVVERHARDPFNDCPGPVDPNAVLPLGSWLEKQGLA